MTEEHAGTVHDGEHVEFNLWAIGAYLLVLTAASFSTYFLEDALWWGRVTNTLFVLMISVCKASLVVGFFMHFKFEKAWKYVICIPPATLAVTFVFVLMPDMAYQIYPKLLWNQ